MSNTHEKYRCIGKGFYGSVWELETRQGGERTAIKREDGGPRRSVTNDYIMHLRILHGACRYPLLKPLMIPLCHSLIQACDIWWQENLRHFPSNFFACRALISERIPKVPRSISNKLVDLFLRITKMTTLA